MRRSLLILVALCAVFAGRAAAGPPVPRFAGCHGEAPQVRPHSITVACADGNFYLAALTWSRWTASAATATATAHLNDCRPYCAAGHFHAYRVTVRLARAESCRGNRREFTRLTYSFVDRKPAGFHRTETLTAPFSTPSGCP